MATPNLVKRVHPLLDFIHRLMGIDYDIDHATLQVIFKLDIKGECGLCFGRGAVTKEIYYESGELAETRRESCPLCEGSGVQRMGVQASVTFEEMWELLKQMERVTTALTPAPKPKKKLWNPAECPF